MSGRWWPLPDGRKVVIWPDASVTVGDDRLEPTDISGVAGTWPMVGGDYVILDDERWITVDADEYVTLVQRHVGGR